MSDIYPTPEADFSRACGIDRRAGGSGDAIAGKRPEIGTFPWTSRANALIYFALFAAQASTSSN